MPVSTTRFLVDDGDETCKKRMRRSAKATMAVDLGTLRV